MAHANIALIKYWGKRDTVLNIPQTTSISLTLAALTSRTQVCFSPHYLADSFYLNGKSQNGAELSRVSQFLDHFRALRGITTFARVESLNNFPHRAGLASSASGFASLAVATNQALDLQLDPIALSIWARRGSGSAARSLLGGVVRLPAGTCPDGLDARAESVAAANDWPLEVVVAITSHAQKTIGSTQGMQHSQKTSPFYPAFANAQLADVIACEQAIAKRDFTGLATVSEHSCLKMHAVAVSSQPALCYLNPTTLAMMRTVQHLREQRGKNVFFTVDAGPQLKAVCLPQDTLAVADTLARQPGCAAVMISQLGGAAQPIAGLYAA